MVLSRPKLTSEGVTLVIVLVVAVVYGGFDLGLTIIGQEVVFQQDTALECLMPTLDLALGLWIK